VHTLVLTNAAGAIKRDFAVGEIMLIADHINFSGQNPITFNSHDDLGPLLQPSAAQSPAPAEGAGLDMTFAYTPELRQLAKQAAQRLGITLHEGVYIGVRGGSFETPAEIRAFGLMGADAVGMSSVHEVIVAARLGMRVLGLSLLSNMAAGISGEAIATTDIMNISAHATATVASLIEQTLERSAPS
jgi:inosine/guanosine/xanthosine phosphorylase family protein